MWSDGQRASKIIPLDLDFVEDGVRLVSLTFGVTLYTGDIFSKIPESILGCFEKFMQLCPRDNIRYYATSNMRRHKPVTKRTFDMLATWLKPGAPPREDIILELKGGEVYQDAPTFKFKVCAGEEESVMYEDKDANLITMAFPAEWGIDCTEEMLTFVCDFCSLFPFLSGHAGFSFECSRYDTEASQSYAWKKSMRFRGIDISRVPADALAVGQDALKGVGWLTILSTTFIEQLGGVKKMRKLLSKEIEFIEVPGGIILRAGPIPEFGDKNKGEHLPLYKEVYRVIAPFVDIASKRSLSFDLEGDDFVEMTEAWYRRLSDE